MQPMSPVVAGSTLSEIIFAKDQPQYRPLPVLKDINGTLVSRWRLGWIERLRVLFRGDLYLTIMTFNKPLQPVLLGTIPPQFGENGEVA